MDPEVEAATELEVERAPYPEATYPEAPYPEAPYPDAPYPDAPYPEAPVTGDVGVDAALAALAQIATAPLEDQLPVLETVHRTLQDRLADVDG